MDEEIKNIVTRLKSSKSTRVGTEMPRKAPQQECLHKTEAAHILPKGRLFPLLTLTHTV